MLGPTQQVFRASCGGVMIRLRVNDVGGSWITIDRPGHEAFYADIDQNEIAAVLARFQSIGGDPEGFSSFVDSLMSKSPGAFAEEKCEAQL